MSTIVSKKYKLENSKKQLSDSSFELKKGKKILKNGLDIYKIALNTSFNSIVITDLSGKIIWVNDAFTKLTGFTLDEVEGKNPKILKSGKHGTSFYKNMWDTILSGKVWKGEIINKNKSGNLYHEKLKISPVFDENGTITNFIATKQDITNQKKIDAALNEAYIKYEELAYIFNHSPAVGILWKESDKQIVEFVTDNIKQWGYTPEDFYSQKFQYSDIIYEQDKDNFLKKLKSNVDDRKERIKLYYRIVTKDKEIRWVASHLYVRFGENNTITHIQGVILDITERKKAEDEAKYQLEQLMQADKMIALGTLVSGVAHEINNPNNFIMLNIPIIEKIWFNVLPILEDYYNKNGDFSVGERLLFSKVRNSMPLLLGGINEGSQRIKTIVEDLKSFARKDTSGYFQDVNLNSVIQTSVNLTTNLVSKSTDNFSVKYSRANLIVKGNKQKLEQVLINLIENSCQALPDRSKAISLSLYSKKNKAIISVKDEGKGMRPELLRKIQDPFFTTKRTKGGTGLGLSIASKIIVQHKGKLYFKSKPDLGTTAIIELPLKNGN